MLKELTIENVAVIQKANISFQTGFTCLTGETGAGKSIVIDAINAILGDRVSKDIIRSGAEKASIVAVFENLDTDIVNTAKSFEVDIQEECIVSRTISAEGKNIARINGIPTPVAVIKGIFSDVINIHGQHDNQSLLDATKHLKILDSFGTNPSLIKAYEEAYFIYSDIQKQIKELEQLERSKQEDLELLQFQAEEIETAELSAEEEMQLQSQKTLIKNAEKILTGLGQAAEILGGNDEVLGVCSGLQQTAQSLSTISDYSEKIAAIADNLSDMYSNAQELMYEIRSSIDEFDLDMQSINEIEQRLDTYYKLKRKYGPTTEDVLTHLQKCLDKLNTLEFAQEQLEKLSVEYKSALKTLEIKGNQLTQERIEKFNLLADEIQKSLEFLNMPFVKLQLNIQKKAFAKDGQDLMEFYIVTNKGENPKPLSKIASGGELSRIMLAIKSVLAEKELTSTLIFDEIDAGVSGAAALKIGRLLRKTAQNRQVLCVTHAPQIAAFSDNHLYIEKNTNENMTFTSIRCLEPDEKVQEIARIISGENITPAAIENAKEMISLAQNG